MNKSCTIILIIFFIILVVLYLVYYAVSKDIYGSTEKINEFFGRYCKNQEIFDPKDFYWTKNFRNSWMNIKEEYLNYVDKYTIPMHKEVNSIVASCDINNRWKTLYLRTFGKDTGLAKYFPTTMSLINQCPCTLAFFSILEPGAKLSPHIGIYKGVIRYHLALIVPNQWEKCFIDVNGKRLYWTEGSDIMFDDMFMHYAENNTNQSRVVLFLDIKRDFNNIFLDSINSIFLKFVKSNDVLNNMVNNINLYAPQ